MDADTEKSCCMRTVIAIDHGPELSKLSGTRVDVDGGSKHRSSLQSSAVSLMKSLWTIVAEGAVEYCRIIYDVLPDDFMVNGLCAMDHFQLHIFREANHILLKCKIGQQ